MNFTITKPIIVFDTETTGTTTDAKIVELSALKLMPDGSSAQKTWVINPEVNIPVEASNVHGYTNESVKDKPTFKQVAIQIFNFFSDIGGLMTYNGNNFDIPVLYRHFASVELTWDLSSIPSLDVMDVIRKIEPRTLEAMFKKYVGEELENAHSAGADTVATLRLFAALLHRYPEIGETMDSAVKWANEGESKRFLDVDKIFYYNSDGKITFSKGKHKDEVVSLDKHRSYLSWMSTANNPSFLPDAQKIIAGFLNNNK
jgi:DNA polymerase-3 subunit epsilon